MFAKNKDTGFCPTFLTLRASFPSINCQKIEKYGHRSTLKWPVWYDQQQVGWSPVIWHLTGTKAFCTNPDSWLSTMWAISICVESEAAGRGSVHLRRKEQSLQTRKQQQQQQPGKSQLYMTGVISHNTTTPICCSQSNPFPHKYFTFLTRPEEKCPWCDWEV